MKAVDDAVADVAVELAEVAIDEAADVEAADEVALEELDVAVAVAAVRGSEFHQVHEKQRVAY